MRYILFIIMMIQGILCHAAICKHVSGGTETDNRSVLKIQKDLCGYMWFLTYDGINRYDGTHLKRYDLNWGNDSVRSCLYSYNLCTDSKNELWLFSEDGNIWLYNRLCDRFEKYIDLKEKVRGTFSFLCMDDGDNAWLGSNKELYIFHLPTGKLHRMQHVFGNISGLLSVGDGKYYLGTFSKCL